MVAESLARVHRDFDAFLEERVNMNWDEQRRKIFQHFGLSSRDDLAGSETLNRGSFGRSTTQVRQQGGPAAARSVFGRSGLDKSVIGQPGGSLSSSQLFAPHGEKPDSVGLGPDSRFVREKMGHFARKVGELNAARLAEKPYAIFHEFGSVEASPGGDVCAPRTIILLFPYLVKLTSIRCRHSCQVPIVL